MRTITASTFAAARLIVGTIVFAAYIGGIAGVVNIVGGAA